uniref:Uncharacterized protein n=1 Tax=viral metagenome TaxID=1070528 RepID=A0A6C0CPL0_9ZZZZ
MIGENFSKSLMGLVALFVAATFVGWGAVKFDNYLVDSLKLKSTSIIITESLVLATFVVIYVISHASDRNALIKDIKKLGIKEWGAYIFLSLAGVYIALLLNRSLKHWDTSEFRMTGEIVKLLLGGALFFIFTEEGWSYKKLLVYVFLAASAIYFNFI